MKKHFQTLTAILIAAALLITPVFAEGAPYRLMGEPERTAVPLAENEVQARLAEIAPWTVCTHQRAFAYYDTDLAKSGVSCPDCGLTRADAQAKLTEGAVITSAAIRSLCDHQFGDWAKYDDNDHIRICSLCNYLETGSHTVLDATCEEAPHCAECGGTSQAWGSALGHEYAWMYSGDFVSSHSHEYRCVRTDNDGVQICGHVLSSGSCSFTTYWSGESGGMHEVYEICDTCWIGGESAYSECPLTNGGSYCYYCSNPNEW